MANNTELQTVPAATLDNQNCTNCTNITVPGIPTRNEFLAQLEIGIQATIFALAVIGNGGVLLILGLRRKKLTRMNMLIVHLSIADLFVAFFNVLPQLLWDITYTFQGEAFLCGFIKLTQTMAMYASSYVLVTTAIDRYTALCHPLVSQTWTMKKVHLMVAVAWFLSFIFSIPQPIIFRYVERAPGVYDCWATFHPMWTMNLYVTWFFVAVYMIPTCILTFCYGRISCVVWKSISTKEPSVKGKKMKSFVGVDQENGRLLNGSFLKKQQAGNKPRAHVRGSVSRAKVKTVKLTLTVVLCYLICWSPFFIAQLWWAWDENAPFTGSMFVIFLLMASLNSCTNPWIYLAFSDFFSSTCRGKKDRFERSFDSDTRTKMSVMSTSEMTAMGPYYRASHCDRRLVKTLPRTEKIHIPNILASQ